MFNAIFYIESEDYHSLIFKENILIVIFEFLMTNFLLHPIVIPLYLVLTNSVIALYFHYYYLFIISIIIYFIFLIIINMFDLIIHYFNLLYFSNHSHSLNYYLNNYTLT